jgi:hypothetical protein
MNIELRFLKKAIEDRNYISFTYLNQVYKKVEPLKLRQEENKYFLEIKDNTFEIKRIKKLIILKDRV